MNPQQSTVAIDMTEFPTRPSIPPPRRRSPLARLRDRLPGAFVAGRTATGWFAVHTVRPQTYLIHEQRYWQRNSNYLLVGDERALLVDTGSGLSDLPSVVALLTDRPVTALPTHVHWDHIGGIERFDRHALLDVPATRRLAAGATVQTTYPSSLSVRGHTFKVDDWLEPNTEIDLGGRRLEVLSTPGHSADGLTLVDRRRRVACVGDLLYEGLLLAALPGSGMASYAASVRRLGAYTNDVDLLLPGHGRPLHPSVVGPLARAIGRVAAGGPRRVPGSVRLHDEFTLLVGRRASRR
jgi:glyoxylase-like metal-dependent hydrolase (beta-lactamase superfamily II)